MSGNVLLLLYWEVLPMMLFILWIFHKSQICGFVKFSVNTWAGSLCSSSRVSSRLLLCLTNKPVRPSGNIWANRTQLDSDGSLCISLSCLPVKFNRLLFLSWCRFLIWEYNFQALRLCWLCFLYSERTCRLHITLWPNQIKSGEFHNRIKVAEEICSVL